jgi:hypothetical protein
MVKYICEKCGKEFTQKGCYTKHINKKKSCVTEVIEIIKKSNEECEDNESEQIILTDKDAKLVREEGLDKFYTLPVYSKKCIDKVFEFYSDSKWDLIIEPSAGNGSFLNQIPLDNNNNHSILFLLSIHLNQMLQEKCQACTLSQSH